VETNRFSILLNRLNARDEYTSKEAVIKAQKRLFTETPHPVYWAPFVLFGYGG
jgi:CHAT domain-containing protein